VKRSLIHEEGCLPASLGERRSGRHQPPRRRRPAGPQKHQMQTRRPA